jgi:hypothetical protein
MRRVTQRVTDGQNNPVVKTTWEKISGPITIISVIVAGLLGLFVFYQTQQKEIWEGRLNQSKEQLDKTKQELDKTKQELDKTKQDLTYAEQEAKKLAGIPKGKETTGSIPFVVTVLRSEPLKATEDLSIALTDLQFKDDPPGYTIKAKVMYKGFPEMQILDAVEGYKVTYPKENGYEIQLLKATSVSARFSIKKNSK